MGNLDKYVKKIKAYIMENPHITEDKIIRYVYLDLGSRFSFDLKFAFGNSKLRKTIYNNSANEKTLNNAMLTNEGNCKVIANILKYVLHELGIDITTEILEIPYAKCPHVYNIITQKNGKKYSVDLQADLENIQSHSFTKRYGLSVDDSDIPALKRLDIEQIDRELGFIDNEHYYADDYLYMLKSDMVFLDNFNEKVKFILENIDICENENIKYAERKWHHECILEKLFSSKELRKIHMLDCYIIENGNKKYINYISVDNKNQSDIYVYSAQKNGYQMISMEEFARRIKDGLVSLQKVQGLTNTLQRLEGTELF